MSRQTLFSLRFVYTTVGIAIFAFGILLSVQANAGVNPWTVFHLGIAQRVGMTQGRVAQIVGIIIIAASYAMGIKPHVATIMNMIMVGGFYDLFYDLRIVSVASSLPSTLLLMAGSIALMGLGGAMYMSGGLGAGPRDSLMLALTSRTGWPVGRIRTLIELTVLTTGWMLGGPVGVGTVVFSLSNGPAVQ